MHVACPHTLIMNSITHKKKQPTLALIKAYQISLYSSINTIWFFPRAIELLKKNQYIFILISS